MPKTTNDISRRRDILEKVIGGLLISLLACMGVHAAGCASQPAYAIGIHAAIASDDDLLPKTGGYSKRTNAATPQPTPAPAPATQPPPKTNAAPTP